MAGTPGPNNAMLTSSGSLWGFPRTVPHMLGVTAPDDGSQAAPSAKQRGPLGFIQAVLFQWVNRKPGW
jgi:threonine/homoserine/homoserine lactone efflux protein